MEEKLVQLGIFAKTFNRSTSAELAQTIAGAGYECTQFNMSSLGIDPLPLQVEPGLVEEARRAFEANRVGIPVVSGTYNMIDPNPDAVAAGRAGFLRLAELSASLGYSTITLCTGSRDPRDKWAFHPDNTSAEAWGEFLTELEQLIQIAEQHNILLGIEPEPSNVISNAALARRLIDEVRSDRLTIVFDPANLVHWQNRESASEALLHAFDLLAERTTIIHAQDLDFLGKPAAPGNGFIDFSWLLKLFIRSGFTGPVIAHGFAESEAIEVATHLRGLLNSDAGRKR